MRNVKTTQNRRAFLQNGFAAATGLTLMRPAYSSGAYFNSRLEVSLHQFSVKPLFTTGQLDLMGYPRFAKESLGLDNIEFAADFCTPLCENPEKADAVRHQSEKVGIKNRVLLCAGDKPLDVPGKRDRAEAIRDHLQWAKVAERLGCEFMRVRASSEGDPNEKLNHAAQGIGAVCEALESSSVSVLIENIAGLSRNPDWLVQLAKRIGLHRVALLADFGNFDGDVYEGMEKLLPYTKSICSKSWDFDPDGNETKLDYARMMQVIEKSQFRGCIAIEYLGKNLAPLEGIRKTAALIRRLR